MNTKSIKFAFSKEPLLEAPNKKRAQFYISSTIFKFKKELRRKKISCRTNFYQPDQDSRFGDFGALEVSIDTSCGRAKNMSIKSMEKFVKVWADRTGLSKFFNFSGTGVNTDRFEVDFDLKDKYVKMFMKDDLPIDIIDVNNNPPKEPEETLSKHIRLL